MIMNEPSLSHCLGKKSHSKQKFNRSQTTPKRTEPAFIEPMQCKPVTALPTGEKWTFEIKFDGYRCIAVKRDREVTLFSRHEKVLNRRFPRVVEALASLGGRLRSRRRACRLGFTKENLHFSFCNTTFRSRFRFIFTPSIYLTEMGNSS